MGHVMANDESEAGGDDSGSVLRDWVLPIVAGVALGAGGLWALRSAGVDARPSALFQSEVERLVLQWDWEDPDRQDELAEEIAALGADVREDLRTAYRSIDGSEFPEHKAWVADLLLAEPFYDSRFLIDETTGGEPWDARIAAVALVKNLGERVDPSVVAPPLLEWLADAQHMDHGLAYGAVGELLDAGLLTTAQRDELRERLMALATAEGRPAPDETEWIYVDRAGAAHLLYHWIPDPEVERTLRTIALDDSDDYEPRLNSVRALAGAQRFDDVEFWAEVARANHHTVRQAVADNLSRTKDPAFDPVLAELHRDEWHLTRSGSVDTQIERRRPTPLDDFAVLVEDHSKWVRFHTLLAAAKFKDHPGADLRLGVALRLLTEGEDTDVEGAILLLFAHTDEHFGFERLEVQERLDSLDEAALQAFLADPEHRRAVREKFESILPETARYTDADRRAALEILAEHADEENRSRARAELGSLQE